WTTSAGSSPVWGGTVRTPLWAIGIRLWAIGVAAALMAGCAVRAGATPDPVGAVGAPGSDTPPGDDGHSGGHADGQLDGQNECQVDGRSEEHTSELQSRE